MTNASHHHPIRSRGVRAVTWFLAGSYAVGAVVVAWLEYHTQSLSLRLGVPPLLVYVTSLVQLACIVGMVRPRWTLAAVTVLTVMALGAIGLHLTAGAPLRALPAVFYAAIQLWLIAVILRRKREAAGRGQPIGKATD